MSEIVAIDSFAFADGIFFVRFGDIGSDGGARVAAVEVTSEGNSFGFGVGDRGGVCSDGGKRFDDAWAKESTDKRPSISLFGGGGDNGIF